MPLSGLATVSIPGLQLLSHRTGEGQFEHPTGVSVDPDSGNIIVTDAGNSRVQIFDGTGAFLASFGNQGVAPEQFNHPYESVVGHGRSLFTSDLANDRVSWRVLLGTDQRFFDVLPPADYTGSGGFKHPHGVALDPFDTTLYVADTGNNRIVAIGIAEAADILPPTATITAPAVGATVYGTVDVRGIASDAHFRECVLEYGEGEHPDVWKTVSVSSEPVWEGSLALWDTSGLAGGVYTLRLTVSDGSGNESATALTVSLRGQPAPLIAAASALPALFMPDRAGTMLAYRLAEPATVLLAVVGGTSNQPVWRTEMYPNAYGGMAGENTMAWDGRNAVGQPVEPGPYNVVITARAAGRTDSRIVPIYAGVSVEAQTAALAGPGRSGGGANPAAGRPGGNAAAAGAAAAGSPTGASGAGSGAAGATGSTPPHDNGWHEGENPNGFTPDHPDKSQGRGNNHH